MNFPPYDAISRKDQSALQPKNPTAARTVSKRFMEVLVHRCRFSSDSDWTSGTVRNDIRLDSLWASEVIGQLKIIDIHKIPC